MVQQMTKGVPQVVTRALSQTMSQAMNPPGATARRVARGFSLVELNISLAIVAILSALAMPTYRDYLERAHLAEVVLQIDAMRTKSQAYAAEKGLDLCRWPARARGEDSEYVALQKIVKEGFEALDPAGTRWPRNMNIAVPGTAGGLGPTIQVMGRGANAPRVHLLLQEMKRSGLLYRVALDRPTIAAMQIYLGPACV